METDPNLKITKKPITGAGSMEIHQKDLSENPDVPRPNDEQNVANIQMPLKVQISKSH